MAKKKAQDQVKAEDETTMELMKGPATPAEPATPAATAEPATKGEPGGRKKGYIFDDALGRMPDASAQDLAVLMRELAAGEGYQWEPSADYVAKKLQERSGQPKAAASAPKAGGTNGKREPSMSELKAVKGLIDQAEGGLDGMLSAIEQVEEWAKQAGGMERLQACLRFWQETVGIG